MADRRTLQCLAATKIHPGQRDFIWVAYLVFTDYEIDLNYITAVLFIVCKFGVMALVGIALNLNTSVFG